MGGAGRGEGREDQESESEGLKQGRMTQRLRRLQVSGKRAGGEADTKAVVRRRPQVGFEGAGGVGSSAQLV